MQLTEILTSQDLEIQFLEDDTTVNYSYQTTHRSIILNVALPEVFKKETCIHFY